MLLELLLLASSSLVSQAASSFWPSSVPLLLRSPYFSSWLVTPYQDTWPQFWTGQHILGWNAQVRVDNQAYSYLGRIGTTVKVSDLQITPTRTILSFDAGPMSFKATFLSPIEPDNLVLQSFPFGHLYLDAASSDGQPHSVQLYCDVSGEWLADDVKQTMQWKFTENSNFMFHELQLANRATMQEDSGGLAQDGTFYIASPKGNGFTYQIDNDTVTRSQFQTKGILLNTVTASPRVINDNWPVLAFSTDLGQISSTPASVGWAMGLVRDPTINYLTSSGNQTRSSYFWTQYSTISDPIEAFLDDFTNAKSRAESLDSKLMDKAKTVSSNYPDLMAYALRQTMASVEITTPKGKKDDIMMFMKDIGNSRRSNPVEALFASFPAFMFINPAYGGYLLEPILRLQSTMDSSKVYSPPDLGPTFPDIQGNLKSGLSRGVEDSGSMLIMALAHARFSGDSTVIKKYKDTLKLWADFLTQNALSPVGFATSDGLKSANMTNLAIKGILGIRAFAEISALTGDNESAVKYNTTASNYVQQWQSAAGGGTDHLQSIYGQGSSWALMYNMFPDKWLGLGIIDPAVYSSQDTFYGKQVGKAQSFGLPYDSSKADESKIQWTLLTAATVSNKKTRDALIDSVYARVSSNTTSGVPTTYDPSSGKTASGLGSPAMGATVGFAALDLPVHLSASTVQGSTEDGGGTGDAQKTGMIVGLSLAGLFVLGLCISVIPVIKRYRRKRRRFSTYRQPFDGSTDWIPIHAKQGRDTQNYNSYPPTPDDGRNGTSNQSVIGFHSPPVPSNPQYWPAPSYGDQRPPTHSLVALPATSPPVPPNPQYCTSNTTCQEPMQHGISNNGPPPSQSPPSESGISSTSTTALTNPWSVTNLSYADTSALQRQAPPLPKKRHLPTTSASGPTSPGTEVSEADTLRSEIAALRDEMEEMKRNNVAPEYYGVV